MPRLPRRRKSQPDDAKVAVEQPKPDPGNPRAGSGRSHTNGYLQLEELNPRLRHPACHKVYDEMYRTDGDVHQVVQLTVNPITGGTWGTQPHGGDDATPEDVKIAEAAWWALSEQMKPGLVGHLSEFLPVVFRSGFTPGEIVWKTVEFEGRTWLVPDTIGLMLPRTIHRWKQSYGKLTAIEQYLTTAPGRDDTGIVGDGGLVEVPAKDLLYYRVGAEGDNWEGVSLLRPAYKHWYLKDHIERIDAIAQEREAVGVPVVYPPAGASVKQLDDMEEILRNMRTNEQGYIIMPGMKAGEKGTPDGSGWLIELLGFDRTGGGRDPMPSLNYHGLKIAAAFISEFMKLGQGESGARATAQVQADPFLASIEALAGRVEEVLQRLVEMFVRYNFPGVERFPKIKMSKVDSTSLNQLADYVLKLTQVGALLPDKDLEEFLRARADMPPSNAESVKDREDTEEKTRRMIVGGDPESTTAPDPYGSNAPVGEHKNGKPAGKPLVRGNQNAPKSGGSPSGPGAKGQGNQKPPDAQLDGLYSERARDWEAHVDLDGLAGKMDDAPANMTFAAGMHTQRIAREMADPATDVGAYYDGHLGSMVASVHQVLSHNYTDGRAHVHDELQAPMMLDAGARDRGPDHLMARAELIADDIHHAMRSAALGADLANGQQHAVQAAAERAGMAAARRAGFDHGVAAILHGRHDAAIELDAARPEQKMVVRYSASLDRGTCAECGAADDGAERDLDDPVRLERRPPNPACESNHSGNNRCRCIEVYSWAPAEG